MEILAERGMGRKNKKSSTTRSKSKKLIQAGSVASVGQAVDPLLVEIIS
jgi:hypothetical protein